MLTKEIWNGWKVEKLIGEGSFGKVYKIVREDFGHTYEAALKVIEVPHSNSEIKSIKSEGMTDESITAYFRSMVEDIVEEFALMSKLKGNSNIVSYEDHMVVPKNDKFGWDIYIRMELLTPLFEYLENHSMSVREVIQLGIDICNALEVCQKYNIIHRDIKPENIFVSDIGSFKLGDFGIARQLEKAALELSKKGTYTYMAPEVYKGRPYNSTVDMYSLGIVMYKLLNNNRSPFMPQEQQQIKVSDKEEANLRRISGQDIPKPCNASDRLAKIILKACAYNSKDRYSSPKEMKDELKAVLHFENEITSNNQKSNLLFPPNFESEDTPMSISEPLYIDNNLNEEEPTEYMPQMQENNYSFQSEDNEDAVALEEGNDSVLEYDDEDEFIIEQQLDSNNSEKNKKSKGNIGFISLITILAVLIIVVLIVVFSDSSFNKDEENETTTEYETTIKYVEIPNVVGRTISEATEILDKYELQLYVSDEIYSNDVEGGIIISQSQERQTIPVGSTVTVTVSKGVKLVRVPHVSGMKLKDAKNKLQELGFSVEEEEEYSNNVKKGYVIKQGISTGEEVKEGTVVTITISKGKKKSEITTEQQTMQSNTVVPLGKYSENNALSKGDASTIRNSVTSAVEGSSDSELTNLARYMANNGLTNAAGVYKSLTGSSIYLEAKNHTITIDSDSKNDILLAAQKLTEKFSGVGGEKFGLAVSSSELKVGYSITVVVVYK